MPATSLELLLWLRERRLTADDLIDCARSACHEHGRASPDDLALRILEDHDLPPSDVARVHEILRLAVIARELRDNGDGTLSAAEPRGEYVIAMVRVPVERFEDIRPYVTTQRPAFVVPR